MTEQELMMLKLEEWAQAMEEAYWAERDRIEEAAAWEIEQALAREEEVGEDFEEPTDPRYYDGYFG